jgi:hypothetical protein
MVRKIRQLAAESVLSQPRFSKFFFPSRVSSRLLILYLITSGLILTAYIFSAARNKRWRVADLVFYGHCMVEWSRGGQIRQVPIYQIWCNIAHVWGANALRWGRLTLFETSRLRYLHIYT